MLIYDFKSEKAVAVWFPVNDGVMGGVSRGGLQANGNGAAVFCGEVSLERNGGFASVRSRPETRDLGGFSGIELRVRGDRRKYKLNLKTDQELDGILYRARFEAEPDAWRDVRLPFAGFEPTFRGRVLEQVTPLDPSRVSSFGLMISDRQTGPFRLEIERIAAYANGSDGGNGA